MICLAPSHQCRKLTGRVESSVNLDASGNPDPYFMSLDLSTARHPHTLLVTHFNGRPLTLDHGPPPLPLVPLHPGFTHAPAITSLSYSVYGERYYWYERR